MSSYVPFCGTALRWKQDKRNQFQLLSEGLRLAWKDSQTSRTWLVCLVGNLKSLSLENSRRQNVKEAFTYGITSVNIIRPSKPSLCLRVRMAFSPTSLAAWSHDLEHFLWTVWKTKGYLSKMTSSPSLERVFKFRLCRAVLLWLHHSGRGWWGHARE